MRFDIITIFPQMFACYLDESILKRAREKGLLEFGVHNLRDYTTDKHKTVDDTPYGGGPGMVLKIEPIVKAVASVCASKTENKKFKTRTIILSAVGKQFDVAMAKKLSRCDQLILICGRYEGVDARVKKILRAEEVSVGPYVLTGGELPATIILDAVSRYIPGVLGNDDSLEDERYGVGVPTYTRPDVFEWQGKRYRVPKVLLSGDHKKIENWRKESAS